MALLQEEFTVIKSLSGIDDLTFDLFNHVRSRVDKANGCLQLKFPRTFRNGVLLQYLIPFIESNKNISHFAAGLESKFSSGFNAFIKILSMKNIIRCDLRIKNLTYSPNEFYYSLKHSKLTKLYLRFDEIDDKHMKLLCNTLNYLSNTSLTHLSFACHSLSDQSIEYFADFLSNNHNNSDKSEYQHNNTLISLRFSMQIISSAQTSILCNKGFKHLYWRNITHLDIEDCKLNYDGMNIFVNILKTNKCSNIRTLTIGNNGFGSIHSFFEVFDSRHHFDTLVCNESYLNTPELIELDTISCSLNKVHNLRALSIPLFIFESTTIESIEKFTKSLSHCDNQINTLQIFPLFEHLDNSTKYNQNYVNKISHLLFCLFDSLSQSKYLQKLHLEMIGSENHYFTKKIANSFKYFLLSSSSINELYLPFCYLVDLNKDILNIFEDGNDVNQKTLVSIKDDTLDYHWLDQKLLLKDGYIISEIKEKELIKSKQYHNIIHKQCQENMTRPLLKYFPKCLAYFITVFVGFEANPECWLVGQS